VAAVAGIVARRVLWLRAAQFHTGPVAFADWPQVAEVDDWPLVMVQRTMNDKPGALEHLDLFQALQRRRVVGRRNRDKARFV